MDIETLFGKITANESFSAEGAVGGGAIPTVDLTKGQKEAEAKLVAEQLAARSRSRQKSGSEKRGKPQSGESSAGTSGV